MTKKKKEKINNNGAVSGVMKNIVSASRRTDLPRFHYEWLQQGLRSGRVSIANPRFPNKIYEVDLQPESVHSLVLWSKDFSNVLNDPGHLHNYNLYFQYTINHYSRLLEPNVPAYGEAIRVLEGLLKRYSPEQFNIRFDPVIISTKGEVSPTPHKPGKARLERFTELCRDLAALGMQNCRITTSHLDLYRHVRKRLTHIGLDLVNLNNHWQEQFFARMAETAAEFGLSLFSCAAPVGGLPPAISPGRCIDSYLLEKLFGGKASKAKDYGQRPECRCHKSVDIGDYNKHCLAGCQYCYAYKGNME